MKEYQVIRDLLYPGVRAAQGEKPDGEEFELNYDDTGFCLHIWAAGREVEMFPLFTNEQIESNEYKRIFKEKCQESFRKFRSG